LYLTINISELKYKVHLLVLYFAAVQRTTFCKQNMLCTVCEYVSMTR